jgi:hypothetical protein
MIMWAAILNSPLVSGIITGVFTLGTGWFAIKVFKLQKTEEKTNAAVSILFEVRNAEDKVAIISEKLHASQAPSDASLWRRSWIK